MQNYSMVEQNRCQDLCPSHSPAMPPQSFVARRVSMEDPRMVSLEPRYVPVPVTAPDAPSAVYHTQHQQQQHQKQLLPTRPSAYTIPHCQQNNFVRQVTPSSTDIPSSNVSLAPVVSTTRHRYMALCLARPSPAAPWGLSVSWMQNCLVLQRVQRNTCVVQGYWLAESNLPPSTIMTAPQPQPSNMSVANFVRQLMKQKAIASSALPQDSHTVLADGDCILSIAGRPVSNYGSLAACTTLLKQCGTAVQVVLYRNPHGPVPQRQLFAATMPVVAAAAVPLPKPRLPVVPRVYPKNMAFVNVKTGQRGIDYADNHFEYDPDNEDRSSRFGVVPLGSFHDWLCTRKATWRKRYSVHKIATNTSTDACGHRGDEKGLVRASAESRIDRETCGVSIDFWSGQGFFSHAHWLATRKASWKWDYSWNCRKRKALEHDCEETVHVTSDPTHFDEWLRIRKKQWKVQRRKRQRKQRFQEGDDAVATQVDGDEEKLMLYTQPVPPQHSELMVIDAILEDQEREQSLKNSRPPFDISFLFDAELGCPDDVAARIFTYLDPMEHGKLLCLSHTTRSKLMTRQQMWRQICLPHWKLPRRPRKPWHEIYSTHLRVETERSRKRWDDLLSRVSTILLNGDQVQSIEKIVTEAERSYNFNVNYVSGVVCERNSLLNLAVIHQRQKVVRWLVESKGADIESSDRGNFTPLLNAAYAGNKFLVRFLMHRGSDRSKIGTFHYTKPLSHPDFSGLNAEGWAERKGYDDIAKLLRLGV